MWVVTWSWGDTAVEPGGGLCDSGVARVGQLCGLLKRKNVWAVAVAALTAFTISKAELESNNCALSAFAPLCPCNVALDTVDYIAA